MKLSLANAQHAYARLAPRERLFVAAGAAAFAAVVLFVVVHGLYSAKQSLRDGIAAKRRQLEQIQTLRAQYLELKRQTDELTAKSGERSPSWLYATLEGLITKTVSRDRIHSMDPSSKTIGDRFAEDSINVELLGVTLQQTLALLHGIEQSATPIHVSRLQMKKRVSDPYQFDVVFTVSSVKGTGA
jgi:general secretion pathway protein M